MDIDPHPEPPGDLARRDLPIAALDRDWHRIHSLKYAPIFFGRRAVNRFDAPAGEFGVLYVGATTDAAFIETFGHATGDNFVQQSELLLRGISVIRSSVELQLVDLTGPGLARLGADERLCSSSQLLARRWSAAFYAHPSAPGGILYRARHDPSELCVALFDRVETNLSVIHTTCLGESKFEDELSELLVKYDFGLT